MNGKTIIPIKIDPSPAAQVKDPDNYTLRETTEIDIKQVFTTQPTATALRTVASIRKVNNKLSWNNNKILDTKLLRRWNNFSWKGY